MTLANLGIKIDTSALREAQEALQALADAADRADAAINKLKTHPVNVTVGIDGKGGFIADVRNPRRFG